MSKSQKRVVLSCSAASRTVSGASSEHRIRTGNGNVEIYIREGEELVRETFQRLIQEKQLVTYRYDGFFAAMDTFKDKQNLDELYTSGKAVLAGLEGSGEGKRRAAGRVRRFRKESPTRTCLTSAEMGLGGGDW